MLLRVRTSPNSKQKTTTKDDQVNPIWNEDFKFYLNPQKRNILGMLKNGFILYPFRIFYKRPFPGIRQVILFFGKKRVGVSE